MELEFNEQRVVKDPATALHGTRAGTFLGTPVYANGSKGEPTVFVNAEGHSIKNIIQPGVQYWLLARIGEGDVSQQYERSTRERERELSGSTR